MTDMYSAQDIAELKGQIIDQFEDLLADNGITLDNNERNDAISQTDDPSTIAIIYGSQYDDIGDVIEYDVIPRLNDINSDIQGAAETIFDAFFQVLKKHSNDSLFQLSVTSSKHVIVTQIKQTLENWYNAYL